MIGFFLFYWIWKGYSNLAIEYNKNKWKYFFIGVVSYYIIGFISAMIYAFVLAIINGFDSLKNEDFDSTGLNLVFAAFAGLGCYGVYKYLEGKAEREKELSEKEGIESIGLMEEN